MSFQHRKIDIVLSLGTGPDGQTAGDSYTLKNHRVSASCSAAGGAGMYETSIRIFGMTESLMNEFSLLGIQPLSFRNNIVEIHASNEAGSMSKIFEGTITAAYIDFMAAPEVAFNITALSGMLEAVSKPPPTTFPGSVDAAVVLAGMAKQANLEFKNNGVSVMLSKPYYPGSIRAQIQECVEDAHVNSIIDNGTLAIWPKGGSRGGDVPLISPETGMVGYPTYTATGIVVTSGFNPVAQCGGAVQVQSSLKPACGTWNVVTLVHDIESEVPGGKWFTQMQLAPPNLVVIPSK